MNNDEERKRKAREYARKRREKIRASSTPVDIEDQKRKARECDRTRREEILASSTPADIEEQKRKAREQVREKVAVEREILRLLQQLQLLPPELVLHRRK